MDHPPDIGHSAEDEALRWLVDFEDLSEVEQARFHVWLDARPENRIAFEKVEHEWRQLDVVRELATNTSDPKVVNKWLRRRRMRRCYVPMVAAAALAAVAVVAVQLSDHEYQASFRTAVGQHRAVGLPDGSVMTINTNSEAAVDYREDQRRVRLIRGEAHFDVAPATERPFSVLAGPRSVRAVGTAFNVYLKGDVVEITVTEGIVEVRPNEVSSRAYPDPARPEVPASTVVAATAPERLRKGQKFEYGNAIESISTIDPAELARQQAWQVGMLDFQGETLAKVIEEASRYTETQMTITDPELKDLHVTGYIRAGDIDILLELIDSNDRVVVKRVGPRQVQILPNRN